MRGGWAAALMVIGFLVTVPAPASAAPEEFIWGFADPVGDAVHVPGTPALVPSPLADLADIRQVRMISEEPVNLTLAIQLGEFGPSDPMAVFLGTILVNAEFGISDFPAGYKARVEIWVYQGAQGYTFEVRGGTPRLCIAPGPAFDACFVLPVDAVVDSETNEVVFELGKEELAGRGFPHDDWYATGPLDSDTPTLDAPPEGTPAIIERGMVLRDVRVRTEPYGYQPPAAYDQAPDSGAGPPYEIRSTMANAVVQLSHPTFRLNRIDIDEAKLFLLPVRNMAPEPRVITPRVVILDDDVDSARFYSARVPDRIEIPARGQATLALVVESGADPSPPLPQTYARFEVHAPVEGHPEEFAYHRFYAESGKAVNETDPKLFLHHPKPSGNPACQAIQSSFPCTGWDWLDARQDHPEAEPNGQATGTRVNADYLFRFFGPVGFPHTFSLYDDGFVEATLRLSSVVPMVDVPIHALITGWLGEPIAAGTTTATLESAPTDLVVPMAVVGYRGPYQDTEFPVDFYVGVGPNAPLPIGLYAGPGTDGPRLHTDASFVQLPLRLPPVHVSRSGTTPFHVGAESADVPPITEGLPVPPSGARRVNITVFNEGPEDVVTLRPSASSGWTIRLDPGSVFRLPSMASITVHAFLEPTPTSFPPSTGTATIDLVSETQGSPFATVHLELVVVPDVPASAPDAVADPLAQRFALGEDASSVPGFPLVGTLATLAVLAAWRPLRNRRA